MHFFNPAPVLKLVEVVRTAHTTDEVFDTAYDFAQRLGKEPIALQRHARVSSSTASSSRS